MKVPNKSEIDFINNNLNTDTSKLLFQRQDSDIDIKFCVTQIEGIKKAKEKFPSLITKSFLLFPPKLNIEQTSSEQTATYKATLFNESDTIADITGGLGIDTIFFAQKLKKVYYFEKNTYLSEIAQYNFKVLGLDSIDVRTGDSKIEIESIEEVKVIYVDPARRDKNDKKVFNIKDCEPNITELIPLLFQKTKTICIKLSPMLDINHAIREVKNIAQIHILSVRNECKELLFVLQKDFYDTIEYFCVDIKNNEDIDVFKFSENEQENANVVFANDLGKYLYEPCTSILKASAFKIVSQKYNICKLAPHSHLYTSNNLCHNFLGRRFEIIKTLSTSNKSLKELEITNANITVRNYPESVSEIRKRTKIKEGGDDYLFFTTNNKNEKIAILCRKIKTESF